MAALNLAAKVREMPVKLSDVVNICHRYIYNCLSSIWIFILSSWHGRCLHPSGAALEVSDLYWHLKDSVARYELLLLRALRFDINVSLPHPVSWPREGLH